MEISQRRNGYAWRPEVHARAGDRVEHPRRHHDDHTLRNLDVDMPARGALAVPLFANTPPIMRMPAIVDDDFLPDMGRMNG